MGEVLEEKAGNWLQRLVMGKFGDKIIRIEVNVGNIFDNIKDMKESMKEINTSMKDINGKFDDRLREVETKIAEIRGSKFTESNSPIGLNKEGKELLENTKMKSFVDSNLAEFIRQIRALKPQNSYQIQEAAKKVLFTDFDNNKKYSSKNHNKLQEKAYELGVNVNEIVYVGSIYLRDLALKEIKFRKNRKSDK